MRNRIFAAYICLLLAAACQKVPLQINELVKDHKATVFIFLATDCPLSQSYTLTLNDLRSKFSQDSVAFHGVFAGSSLDSKAIDDFVQEYKISVPILLDRDWSLANYFQATKTPETFVVNTAGAVLYKGAIDDWSPALGQHRPQATRHYLADALDSILQNKPVQIQQTEAVGCFIEKPRG